VILEVGAISQAAAQTLAEDSTVVAFIYGGFGLAFIESTPYVLVKCLCSRLMDLSQAPAHSSLLHERWGVVVRSFCVYPPFVVLSQILFENACNSQVDIFCNIFG
jgi:hypothetical protein